MKIDDSQVKRIYLRRKMPEKSKSQVTAKKKRKVGLKKKKKKGNIKNKGKSWSS